MRASLLGVLGTLALRVDHIGSTAVPGLGAKNIIDIQVTVAALTTEVRQTLVQAGYEHQAAIQVKDACRQIADGHWITVDGKTGVVEHYYTTFDSGSYRSADEIVAFFSGDRALHGLRHRNDFTASPISAFYSRYPFLWSPLWPSRNRPNSGDPPCSAPLSISLSEISSKTVS